MNKLDKMYEDIQRKVAIAKSLSPKEAEKRLKEMGQIARKPGRPGLRHRHDDPHTWLSEGPKWLKGTKRYDRGFVTDIERAGKVRSVPAKKRGVPARRMSDDVQASVSLLRRRAKGKI